MKNTILVCLLLSFTSLSVIAGADSHFFSDLIQNKDNFNLNQIFVASWGTEGCEQQYKQCMESCYPDSPDYSECFSNCNQEKNICYKKLER